MGVRKKEASAGRRKLPSDWLGMSVAMATAKGTH